ncbi:hypothetical protein UFOVP783_66 [uncultured Caudovirales phage]|uniref:Uncharacterized protein n=1 Tax=uncultured Caudovirales phage TaxID=2100421 RepID=A0A6J5NZN8_9CAUD|nr:hypothetical protein UFOVP783_66 [uncultured Caudovirales phage]
MKDSIPPVKDFAVYNAPLACIFKRLAREHAAGGMLAGMKLPKKSGVSGSSVLFASSAFEQIDEAHLPCVRYRGTLTSEAKSAMGGSLGPTAPKQARLDAPFTPIRQIQISVMSSITAGILNPRPDIAGSKPGHEDWVALVLDAIETGDDQRPDATLDKSTPSPIYFSIGLPEVESEVYYESIITITVAVPAMYRAQRHNTLCQEE